MTHNHDYKTEPKVSIALKPPYKHISLFSSNL